MQANVTNCLYSDLVEPHRLVPNPRNPNTHPDEQIRLLAKVIDHTGWRHPIVVSKRSGFVVEGHARLLAAQLWGYETVPVHYQDWVNEAQEWADMLADNRLAELAEIDSFVLKDLIEELDTGAIDLELTGYTDQAIEDLMTAVPPAWNPDPREGDDIHDGIAELVGYNLGSFWKDISRVGGKAFEHMLPLPIQEDVKQNPTVKYNWSRTNSLATERIVRTYMREGDIFYEMCCGWVTFSSTAKCWGFSGKASDIWDKALEFDHKQLAKMPGDGVVELVKADCRDTGEPDDTYDFVHSNPPFFSLEEYSDNPADLSGLGSYDKWLLAMVDMGKEAERILKPNGLANFVLNDYRDGGYLINMHGDFVGAILGGTGLRMWDIVVSEVISQSLRFRKKSYKARRTVKCHEYIMTFKKVA